VAVTGILAGVPGRITSSTFVGRKDRLESLLAVFDATLTGPAVVLLGGEAGIGKTRLVSEFAGTYLRPKSSSALVSSWVKQSCRICHWQAFCES
jgi:MoxR-like ATPase